MENKLATFKINGLTTTISNQQKKERVFDFRIEMKIPFSFEIGIMPVYFTNSIFLMKDRDAKLTVIYLKI